MSHLSFAPFAAVILLAGLICSQGSAETYSEALAQRLDAPAEDLKVDGRPAFVLLPKDRPAGPQPWIMYAPALPAYPDAHERWMHERFVAAGVAVAGVDIGEAYGSPRGQAAMSALYNELVENRGFAPRVCLLGRSRGGLWALSWAGRNVDKVAGIVGIYPAFDLRTYPSLEKAAPAYGLTTEQLGLQLEEFNPIEQAGALAAANVRAMFIHGRKDEIVPFEPNVGEFARRYRAAGAKDLVTVLEIPDQGHNFWEGFFRSEKLAEFAISRAQAGAAATSVASPLPAGQ